MVGQRLAAPETMLRQCRPRQELYPQPTVLFKTSLLPGTASCHWAKVWHHPAVAQSDTSLSGFTIPCALGQLPDECAICKTPSTIQTSLRAEQPSCLLNTSSAPAPMDLMTKPLQLRKVIVPVSHSPLHTQRMKNYKMKGTSNLCSCPKSPLLPYKRGSSCSDLFEVKTNELDINSLKHSLSRIAINTAASHYLLRM